MTVQTHDLTGFLHDAIPDILADRFVYRSQGRPINFNDWRDHVPAQAAEAVYDPLPTQRVQGP